MATFSPRVKSAFAVMVWWISVSKTVMKQVLQSFEWSFGRSISARFVWQSAQGEGAIFARVGVEDCRRCCGEILGQGGDMSHLWWCGRVMTEPLGSSSVEHSSFLINTTVSYVRSTGTELGNIREVSCKKLVARTTQVLSRKQGDKICMRSSTLTQRRTRTCQKL
jgi:hypothetical protein